MSIFVFGTIPNLGDGRRFFGIRYVRMNYSQSTASAVLRLYKARHNCLCLIVNLNSTASAVLRQILSYLKFLMNLNSTASAVLRRRLLLDRTCDEV